METPKTMSPVKQCPDAPRKKPLRMTSYSDDELSDVQRVLLVDDDDFILFNTCK